MDEGALWGIVCRYPDVTGISNADRGNGSECGDFDRQYHFAILSAIGFFLLRPLYRVAQDRYFPYRHGNRDLYLIILVLLGFYLWALEFNPAMVRSFGMIAIGYWLYDRGNKDYLISDVEHHGRYFAGIFFETLFFINIFGLVHLEYC